MPVLRGEEASLDGILCLRKDGSQTSADIRACP